jgi:hypothetical protein
MSARVADLTCVCARAACAASAGAPGRRAAPARVRLRRYAGSGHGLSRPWLHRDPRLLQVRQVRQTGTVAGGRFGVCRRYMYCFV